MPKERIYCPGCPDCSDYVGLLAGHVSERGHGGAHRDFGETLPERPARVHLGARHQRQTGERVGQQGGVPQTGLCNAATVCVRDYQDNVVLASKRIICVSH